MTDGTGTPSGAREPGGWELYRGIERIEKTLREQSASYVPIGVFNEFVKRADERDNRKGIEIRDLKADNTALEERIEADKRVKSQQWFAIGLAGLVAILGIIGQIVSFTVNSRGGA